MDMDKKNNFKTYMYAIIAVVSFIAVCIGSSVAVFVSAISKRETPVNLKSAEVVAFFEAENSISDENILPGYSNQLFFSITNVSEEENVYGNYTLFWDIVKNEINDDNFVYTLEGNSYRGDNNIPISDTNKLVSVPVERRVPDTSVAIGTGVINKGVTHNYTLTLKFVETGTSQNDLQGKTFSGKVVAKGEPNL